MTQEHAKYDQEVIYIYRVRCQSSDTIIKSDTAELFATVVLETLMLSTFQVGVNSIRSVLFWAIPIKT